MSPMTSPTSSVVSVPVGVIARRLVRFALPTAVVLALITAPPAPATDWPQYGVSARHESTNKAETILDRSNVSSLRWVWAGEVGAARASAPIVAAGTVYVAAGTEVFAFDARSGVSRWSRPTCGGGAAVEPAFANSRLFVGDDSGHLAAFDPASGAQLWCRDERGSIGSAPAVEGSWVYVTNGVDLVAVNQADGAERWRFTPADSTPLTSTPAISHGVVYTTGGHLYGGTVFAASADDGTQLWRTYLGWQLSAASLTPSGHTLYVGGYKPYALDGTTGSVLWSSDSVGVNVSTPALYGNKLFVNSQDPGFGLFALKAIGQTASALVWRAESVEEPESTVSLANGVVYDIDDFGLVEMFDSETGVLLGSVGDPERHPFGAFEGAPQPAVANGTLYVSTADYYSDTNRLDAFRLP